MGINAKTVGTAGRHKPLLHSSMAASLRFYQVSSLQKMGIDLSVLPELTEEIAVLG